MLARIAGRWFRATESGRIRGQKMNDQALAAAARDLAKAAGLARQWVGEVQPDAPRVASEALSLTDSARRIESAAGKLERAAGLRMCVGIFGPSQSGKSYLVSALCKPPAGPGGEERGMIADFAGRQLDFISEINPPGDKESTGLVTRLSTVGRESPRGYPVSLQLLTETDLVRILANSFLCDFDANRLEFDPPVPGQKEVRALLAELQSKAPGGIVAPHLDERAIFDLGEYFARNFPSRTGWLASEYWSYARHNAGRLPLADRARLFSVLWGGIPEFTELYLKLTAALAELDFAPEAFAAMAAIEPRETSIIDVDRIKLDLGTAADERSLVKVLGMGPGIRREAALPRAVLCALVAELRITLKNPTWPIFENVDLLDFPGARSREKYSNIRDKAEGDQDVARRPRELFIRGKIAVLFQRYTDNLELFSMLLCMPGGTAEVKDLGLLVREWIYATHGETPAERAQQRNALFVVLTKSDLDFVKKDGDSEESRRKRWHRRIFASMIELYQRDMWLDNWNGRPFDNALWLRNPGVEQNHLVTYRMETRDGRELPVEPRVEVGYAVSIAAELPALRDNFLSDAEVVRYFRDPGRAFDALLKLNDGGVAHIIEQVSEACDPAVKSEQIRRRLLRQAALLSGQFGRFYDAGSVGSKDETLKRSLAVVNAVGAAIRTDDGYRAMGRFIGALSAQESELYELYLNVASLAGPETAAPPADAPAGLPDVFEALGGESEVRPQDSSRGTAEVFARKAVQTWIRDLRRFAADEADPRRRRLDRAAAEYMAEQIIGAMHRLGVAAAIARDVGALMSVSASWEAGAALAACIAANRINNVVCFLGYGDRPESERPPVPPAPRTPVRRAFRPPETFAVAPVLGDKARPIAADFAIDWMASFVQAAVDNIGHAHGRDISPEQNAALGRILDLARLDARLAAAS
jgi:hypothetical protein